MIDTIYTEGHGSQILIYLFNEQLKLFYIRWSFIEPRGEINAFLAWFNVINIISAY